MRTFLFLFGCIGTRLLLTWLAATQEQLLKPLGIFAAIVSIGFLTIYTFGLRKSGPETFGEQIWWNDLRPLHGFNYGLFAWLALNGDPGHHAWKVLLIDTMIGLGAWLQHRYSM